MKKSNKKKNKAQPPLRKWPNFFKFLEENNYPEGTINSLTDEPDQQRIDKAQKRRGKARRGEQIEWRRVQNENKLVGVDRKIIGDEKALEYSYKYYKTEDWKSRSLQLKEEAGNSCRKCGQQGGILTMHHMTYAYRPHTEPEEILECVCQSCHILIHEINKIVNGHYSEGLDHPVHVIDRLNYVKIIEAIDNRAPWLIENNDFENVRILVVVGQFVSATNSKLSYLQKKVDEFLDLEKLNKVHNDIKELVREKEEDQSLKLWRLNAPHLM